MPPSRPNVLFVFADQHRHDWLGTNPDVPVRTPNVDQLAERGVRFTNAITPSPVCAAARASLAGGVEYPRSPVNYNGDDFPTDQGSLYGRLRDEAGYHVTGCGKFDLAKNTYEWGVDGASQLEEWGFSEGIDVAGQVDAALAYTLDRHPASMPDAERDLDDALDRVRAGEDPHDPFTAYLDERGLLEAYIEKHRDMDGAYTSPLPDYAFQDEWIGRRTMDLLVDLPTEQPWFMQVNFGGPHSPFDVTREMHGWYRDPDTEFPPPRGPGADPGPADQEIRRNYAAKIELIDRWLGQYLARLDDRGELEDTLVVYSADHGEMLGDRGDWGKSQPEHPSLAVPMVAAGPGVASGVVCDTPVSVLDLHRTFCGAAGLDSDAEGRSLWPLLEDRAFDRELVYSALGDWELVFDGQFKLVERDGPESRTLYEVTDGGDTERRLDDNPGTVARLAEGIEAYRDGWPSNR